MKRTVITDYIFILLLSCFLFIPFLGKVHLFDWDEINFAECAREMIVTSDYSSVTINYQPFWEKPPLFIWMQVLSMKTFGINEFAARFPNAVCGVITLLLLFHIGQKIADRRLGWLWVLSYAGSFLPHFYFKSGIIDPWFNLFIFLGIYQIIQFSNELKNPPPMRLIASAVFIGLAILTKGPVALLIFGLTVSVYMLVNRIFIFRVKDLIIFTIALVLTGGSWFIMELLKGRTDVIVDFFNYQVRLLQTEDAGHGGPFIYHFLVLLIGCFPASVFAIAGMKKMVGDPPFTRLFRQWMMILFWVVLILFSIVKTKIVHYSSLCYFPLTFLSAYTLLHIIEGTSRIRKWQIALTAIIGIAIGLTLTIIPFINHFKEWIMAIGLIKDRFANENLKANVPWSGFEAIIGVLFLLLLIYVITRKRVEQPNSFVALFLISMFTVNLAQIIIVPKVEQYSQGAAIEFFKEHAGKNVYLETIRYKSYAYLFYGEKMPEDSSSPLFERTRQGSGSAEVDPKVYKDEFTGWLLNGDPEKPAYFIAKITEADNIKTDYPQLKETGRKNGFVFYERIR